ncbi:MAG: polysaccharide deacetylase family protein [Acidimicrobiia bacterium]|nr:polysaccharide deacetylase family protein [Acidimicrobiia bacterium]
MTGWGARPGANVVLSYHRIRPAAASTGIPEAEGPAAVGMVVHEDRFRRHLAALAGRYEVVPARDARRRGARRRVAITFDDGYADNAVVAAPALRHFGLPATFFATTVGLEAGTEYWWDRLEHALLSAAPVPGRLRLRAGRASIEMSAATLDERATAFRTLTKLLRSSPPTVVEDVVGQLEATTGVPLVACDAHRRMSAAQLRELAEHPLFEIGSHTCTHACLRSLSRTASRRELTRSREVLAEVLGAPPSLLAYPYGAPPSVGRRHRAEARRAGYELAFVNTAGSADRSSPTAVHRLPVVDCEAEELLASVDSWMAGS